MPCPEDPHILQLEGQFLPQLPERKIQDVAARPMRLERGNTPILPAAPVRLEQERELLSPSGKPPRLRPRPQRKRQIRIHPRIQLPPRISPTLPPPRPTHLPTPRPHSIIPARDAIPAQAGMQSSAHHSFHLSLPISNNHPDLGTGQPVSQTASNMA